MTTALVDSPQNLVVEYRRAPETVVPETISPVSLTHLLREDVGAKRRPGSLEARWVPDPRGEQRLSCTWVPRTGAEASAPSTASHIPANGLLRGGRSDDSGR